MYKLSPYQLGLSGNPKAIPFLIEYLLSGNYHEMRLAASAVGKLSHIDKAECNRTVPALILCIKQPYPQLRQYALKTLALLDIPLDAYQTIKKIEEEDEKPYNRKAASEIARKIEKRIKLHREKAPPFNLKKKSNEFHKVISQKQITKLYHITDKKNLASIRKCSGLYSWFYCECNGIQVLKPGGNTLSRRLDLRKGLENYVRLCFCPDQPMFRAAISDGRMSIPYILEVESEVILWETTLFSDHNAASNSAIIGGEMEDFLRINFDIFRVGVWSDRNEYKLIQAEVMVKEFIPCKFILKAYPYLK